MRLHGKVAVITGAASGQGAAAARRFTEEGASVALLDWDGEQGAAMERELVDAGRTAAFYQLDISDEQAVADTIAAVHQRFGHLDVLFNNAGIGYSSNDTYTMTSVLNTPVAHWRKILEINLDGAANVTRHVLPVMIASGGGSIINNSSINAIVGMPGADAYTASKGGLVALTRVWAVDYGRKNVRVNCICPGSIRTPMMADAIKTPEDEAHFSNNLLGRMGTPEEIADIALFFASDESSYLTGVILPADGGWTAQ
ncbi:SDR family NAD(P)-dependent oxidoreductase [Saccharopolyspora sp. 5N708]|uniref:SDR family NAD(P)-dependent oxidoreductase n=1 Tax=Saccharopolyspora sp. 5N708 TaxID=3457424 RepID=UPI003FD0478B